MCLLLLGHKGLRTTYSLMAGVTETLRPWVMILTVLTPFACAAWQVHSTEARLRTLSAEPLSNLCDRRGGAAGRLLKGAVRAAGACACTRPVHPSSPGMHKLDSIVDVTIAHRHSRVCS